MKHPFLAGALTLSVLAVTSLFRVAPAQAFSWDEGANTITIHQGDPIGTNFKIWFFDGYINNQLTAGLTGEAVFTLLKAFNGTTADFKIDVTNTSDSSLFNSSRISGLAFDVDRTLTSATASGVFSQATLNGRYPGGIGRVDVCYSENRNNCSGGRNGGVTLGNTGTLFTTLTFASQTNNFDVVLSDFVVRYQSVDYASTPGVEDESGVGIGKVPTPALLPGLIGMGVAALRDKKKQKKEEEQAV